MLRILHLLSLLVSFIFVAGAGSNLKLNTDLSISTATKSSYQSIFCGYNVRAAYTGPIIKLRKSSTEQDFYGSFNLTTIYGGGGQTLQDWLGAGVKTAFVVTWYDQSGNGRHASQTNQALQPSFDVDNRYVAFKPSGLRLTLPGTIFPTGNSPFTFIFQHNTIGYADGAVFAVGNMATNQANCFRRYSSVNYLNYWWGNDFMAPAAYADNNIVSETYTGTARAMYANSILLLSESASAHDYIQTDGYLGYNEFSGNQEQMEGELYFLVTSNIAIPHSDLIQLESGIAGPSPTPSASPTRTPTNVPSTAPSNTPTITPSRTPTTTPSSAPTVPVYQMYTVAGNGVAGNAADGAVATSSSVSHTYGLFVDTADTFLYFGEYNVNRRVRKIDLITGITTVFAGDGTVGSSGDGGAATSAKFFGPVGVFGTTSGTFYIGDYDDSTIRSVNQNGIITKMIGNGASVSATDANGDGGPASSATMRSPHGIVVDTSSTIYFVDLGNNKVRKVDASGKISTFAGIGTSTSSGDGGFATSASFNGPTCLFVDSAGKIYVTEDDGNRIRLISVNNIISLFAGLASGDTAYANNVPATSTGIYNAYGIWGDSAGNIYYCGMLDQYVRMVSGFSGIVTSIAGTGATTAASFVTSGPALSIALLSLRCMFGDSEGRLFVSDISPSVGGSTIRGLYANTQQPTVTPTVSPSCVPSRAPSVSSAPSFLPSIVPTVPVYQMYTVAGNGVAGNAADGAVATSSSVREPYGIFVDSSSATLTIAEFSGNRRVRRVSLETSISNVFAGDGSSGNAGDGGPATSAQLVTPYGVVGVTSGAVYVCDYTDHSVRVVSSSRTISKVIGNGASVSATDANGDGGSASSATMKNPCYLAADSAGNVYIADGGNNRVRKVHAVSNTVVTVAGTGVRATGSSSYATSTDINAPVGVFVDSVGGIYVSEYGGNQIRVISPVNSVITLFAGLASGGTTYANNVPATATGIFYPGATWVDTTGNLFFAAFGAGHNYLRVISKFSGIVTSIASSGAASASIFVSSGPALSIPILDTRGVSGDTEGRVYVSDFSISTGGSSVRGVYVSTQQPTVSPTVSPSCVPSRAPSVSSAPSFLPSIAPTVPVYQMYTVAGNGVAGRAADGAVATSSPVNAPHGLFVDEVNSVHYIANKNGREVRKIAAGITTVFAGVGSSGNSGDEGQASSAKFYDPIGVARTTSGVVYVSDFSDQQIRAINPNGIISKYAGTGTASSSSTATNGDGGAATSATVKSPYLLTVDANNNLYFADLGNNKVRKIDNITNIITTVVGNGAASSIGDGGFATSAALNGPVDVFVDTSNTMFVTEYTGNRIRVIDSDNIITQLIGLASGSGTQTNNVPATATGISYPYGVWADTAGNVFFADSGNRYLRMMSGFSGIVTTIASSGVLTASSLTSNGAALSLPLLLPIGVRGDSGGRVFVCDIGTNVNSVRGVYQSTQQPTVSPTVPPTFLPSIAPTVPVYQMYTLAGNGVAGNAADGVVATSSCVNDANGVFFDPSQQSLHIAEFNGKVIHKINLVTGITNIFAGTGTGSSSSSGDGGPATSAQLSGSRGVGGFTSGVVYICETDDHSVRKINENGIITKLIGLLGGSSSSGAPNGDGGAATSATVVYPYFVSVDSSNNLYFADHGNHKVRKVNTVSNTISTIAGNGAGSSLGDAGSATSATINSPIDVFVDSFNKIYITEYGGNRIRVISTDNILTLFAGLVSGDTTLANNVPATSAGISRPYGVWSDTVGNVFYAAAGSGHNLLRMVSGFSGIVTTIAGNGASSAPSFVTSGPALSIPIIAPRGVRGDPQGRIFVADSSSGAVGSNAVRGVYASTQQPTATPTVLPSFLPSMVPTCAPSRAPTSSTPSFQPSVVPTVPVYQMYTVAGNGVGGNAADGAVATSSPVMAVIGLSLDSMNSLLYFADNGNARFRKLALTSGQSFAFAGTGASGNDGDSAQATSASFKAPAGISHSTSGTVYLVDHLDHKIRKVVNSGIISTYVGTGAVSPSTTGNNGDSGAATAATMNLPYLIAHDTADNLYIAECLNFKVRKVNAASQTITTIAGTGEAGGSIGDGGFATSAQMLSPYGVYVDSVGRVFIGHFYRVRLIGTDNKISSFAGYASTVVAPTDNAKASASAVRSPIGIWGNSVGDIFFSDGPDNRVRVVSVFSGLINTIAGTGETAASLFVAAAPALSVPFLSPYGVCGDNHGKLFIAHGSTAVGGNVIRAIYASTEQPSVSPTLVPTVVPSGAPTVPVYQMLTVAGNGVAGGAADGAVATSSPVRSIESIFLNSVSNMLYFAENVAIRRFRRVNLDTGITFVFAGTGGGYGSAGDDGQATSATFTTPSGISFTTSGVAFVSDFNVHKVRTIAVNGIITTYAGTDAASSEATASNGDDGPASSASLNIPYYVTHDSSSNLYVADHFNYRVRKIDAVTQVITTIAGTGVSGIGADGVAATSSQLLLMYGVFVDTAGKVYICHPFRIRVVGLDKKVTSIIGTSGTGVAPIDGIPATSAPLNNPYGIWGNTVGDIYFSDMSDCRLRVISAFSGLLNTIAGSGASTAASYIPDGPARSIPLLTPKGIFGDNSGVIFVADSSTGVGGSSLRAVFASTEQPTVITTVAPSMAPTAPTLSPTLSPTSSPSQTPSATPTVEPTVLPSGMPVTKRPSPAPSVAPSLMPSVEPSHTPTMTPTVMPTPLPSPEPTIVPSVVPSHVPTITPSIVPSVQPSLIPSQTPTQLPTMSPTETPSLPPTQTPTQLPTQLPTMSPSALPSSAPSISPSCSPSAAPTAAPSTIPSAVPSTTPTLVPSTSPSIVPTAIPTGVPSQRPSTAPTIAPSLLPTELPTTMPTSSPSVAPTSPPSLQPSLPPTVTFTESPTSCEPTTSPSMLSSTPSSQEPSTQPSHFPSPEPTLIPTTQPSYNPTTEPTEVPSQTPSCEPSQVPSNVPSTTPSSKPSILLSVEPTPIPSSAPPTVLPSDAPTNSPSLEPTVESTATPSTASSSQTPSQGSWSPSQSPSAAPTVNPTHVPSVSLPSELPSIAPTQQNTYLPTPLPSNEPSCLPTIQPTVSAVTALPSVLPSAQPSAQPSYVPTTQSSQIPSNTPQSSTLPTLQRSTGTFPTTTGLSVILPQDSEHKNISVGALMVLPFLRVTPASNSLAQQGFYDIQISSAEKVGINHMVFVNRSPNRPIYLNTLSPSEGFHLSPAVSYDYSGRSVSNAGDINGDGYDDLIIGVPYAARCYVLFGTALGFVNMTEGFTVFGQAGSMTGWSVSGAGDVNNDTFADIVIGAPYARNSGVDRGAAYVIYGKPHGSVNIHLETELLSTQGFAIYGATQSELLGLSVSSAGDVNNDGFDDVIVGALKATSSYRGGAYVVYGTNTSRDIVELSQLNSKNQGFSMSGPIWSYSGYSVSGAGDVNGDGFDDVLVGSVPFRTTFGAQTTYLIYGHNKTMTVVSLSSALTKQQGVVIFGGGVLVSGVGDIDSDGHNDIVIGSNYGFTGAGFVTIRFKDSYQAPSMQPTLIPTIPLTASPTTQPTRKPTAAPSIIPTREPTQRPSRQPTIQQSGPSEPPTEAPTGPTSTPSSVPSISTENPSSCPTTSFPSSRPSTRPTLRPSLEPSKATGRPTLPPTIQPTESMKPTTGVSNPSFRSRNPVFIVPSQQPTVSLAYSTVLITVGGAYEKQTDRKTNYVIDTNETVHIISDGFSGGNIYTVLPHVNGSLHIQTFNNITDKLNLTSHSTIHSMSDLVITSGSVIISFPTSGQRIRLANLTPLDISEHNFMFGPEDKKSFPDTAVSRTLVVVFSSAAVLIVVLFALYQLYRRSAAHALKRKLYKEGIIALEDNPTRLIIAVNDMYAYFDAYIPSSNVVDYQRKRESDSNPRNSSDSLLYISGESKSIENSPLNSFETQNHSNNTNSNSNDCNTKHKEQNSGDLVVSSSTMNECNSSISPHNSAQYSFYNSSQFSSPNISPNSSRNSPHSSQQESDFDISILDSVLLSDDDDEISAV